MRNLTTACSGNEASTLPSCQLLQFEHGFDLRFSIFESLTAHLPGLTAFHDDAALLGCREALPTPVPDGAHDLLLGQGAVEPSGAGAKGIRGGGGASVAAQVLTAQQSRGCQEWW